MCHLITITSNLLANTELYHYQYINSFQSRPRCLLLYSIVLNLKKFEEVVAFCKKESVGLVVVGPEDPLAAGIADHLNSQGNQSKSGKSVACSSCFQS